MGQSAVEPRSARGGFGRELPGRRMRCWRGSKGHHSVQGLRFTEFVAGRTCTGFYKVCLIMGGVQAISIDGSFNVKSQNP